MIYIKKSLIIIFLVIILIYTVYITSIPKKILLFENEKLNIKDFFGIVIKEENTLQVSQNKNNIENKKIKISLFGVVDLKTVQVNTIERLKVIPLGNTIGIKLYSDGVLVIGMTVIDGKKPYENTGIKEGDLIKKVDNIWITTIEKVNESKGSSIEIEYQRDGINYTTNIEPIETKENNYKIGLWVRDGAVGIGTATYYEPTKKTIATLGHGIVDRDTDKLITIDRGEILTSSITSIKRGEKGNPGEIRGIINEKEKIGEITKNTEFGIYGKVNEITELGINEEESMEVALIDEIKTGEAKMILQLEGEPRTEFKIKIKKIYKNNKENNKNMLIEITDKELIEKTGGIIQGMSGAPIIQNEKFIRSCNICIS